MEEWEQETHASECSGWEPEHRWTEPCSWLWNNQDLSDEETFARLTHESSDKSESNCGPYWAPKPVNSSGISVDTFKHTDDGWGSSRDPPQVPPGPPSTPQSSWQPSTDTNMPVIVEPLEVPSSSEQALAPMERIVPDVVHPVQYGIVPERITLPRPDDEINPFQLRRRRLVHTRRPCHLGNS